MNKHTPGPWVADFHTEKVYSADNVVVYELGTNEADGYLISASPDLLEALEAAMAFIESHAADPDLTADMRAKYAALQDLNPAGVISRARGEA